MRQFAKFMVLAVLCAPLGVLATAKSQVKLAPCVIDGVEGGARCGRISVPERRGGD